MRRFVLLMTLVVVLAGMFSVAFKVKTVEASGTITIRADGSIDPPTPKIVSLDNITYTFTDNITDSIVVERSNIIIDGDGYTVQGSGTENGKGFFWSGINNVTVKNTNIKNFRFGIYLNSSSFNTISGSNITMFQTGLYLLSSSNNNTVSGNAIENGGWGASFYSSANNTFSGNTVTNCSQNSLVLSLSANNTFSGNSITKGSYFGVWLWSSSFNIVSENNVTNNRGGMMLDVDSNNNRITGNNITNNNTFDGIMLSSSSNNVLRSNNMVNNGYNFGLYGYYLSDYVNDVDTSNTVDGKPVCYWVNREDLTVPLDAGYVALINCTRITVQNLDLTKNRQSVALAWTTNTTVTENNITKNAYGIYLDFSFNTSVAKNYIANNLYGVEVFNSSSNSIVVNNITNNDVGIYFDSSFNNIVSRNNITANSQHGIYLEVSSYNTLFGNNLLNNTYGVSVSNSSDNSIYHNNFVNNTQQVYDWLLEDTETFPSINVWDNGIEGNYWSNYTGLDSNHDGIGDTLHIIDANNTDHYPLMGTFSDFPVTLEEETHHVTTVCNSTISAFEFDQVNRIIRFNVTGEEGIGFCRLCIPYDLMEPPYTVTVDGYAPLYVNYTLYDNGTNRWIYFTYQHSTHEVEIVPEFPTWTSIMLVLTVLTIAVTIYKPRLLKTLIH